MTLIPPVNPSAVQAPAGKQQFFRTKLCPSLQKITLKQFSNIKGSIMDEVIRAEFAASPQPTRSLFEHRMWPAFQSIEKSSKRL
jgi:hypothetical protein